METTTETIDIDKNRLKESHIVRSIEGNKLVIDCDTLNYKLRMLEANKIPGLLPLEITENDGVKKLCYDITSREAFGTMGATKSLKLGDIRNLLYSLNHILHGISNYLLEPDDLVLDKDYIYVSDNDMALRLCYLPGYGVDFATGLSTLLQDILGAVDHNDHEAVVIAYSLYQASLKPGYVMADLIKILNDEHSDKKDGNRDSSDNGDTHGDKGARNADGQDSDRHEKTTDELFVEYQVPKMGQSPLTALKSGGTVGSKSADPQGEVDKEALFNAVSKPNRRKHATIFSR